MCHLALHRTAAHQNWYLTVPLNSLMLEKKGDVFSLPITRCQAKSLTEWLAQAKHEAQELSQMKTQTPGETICMDWYADTRKENNKVWAEGLCSKAVPPRSSLLVGGGQHILWNEDLEICLQETRSKNYFSGQHQEERWERTSLRPLICDTLSFLQIKTLSMPVSCVWGYCVLSPDTRQFCGLKLS